MALVSLNAVRKSFGSRTVLDGLDFAIEPGARVGVVGANGSGKSTMLKLIAGLEEPDAGTSVRRRGIVVSFLPQHPLGDERNAPETVRRTPRPGRAGSRPPPGRRPARRTGARRRPRPDDARAPPPGGACRALEAAGGPSIDGRARAMLLDLGIVEDDLTLPTSALSGGQRKLIALAAPSPRIPTSCCSTSPKRTSTPSGARCSSGCSRPSTAPPSRSRTTATCSTRRSARSPSSTAAGSGCWPGNYSAYTLARELELQPAAAVRDTAEGDRAARGLDPPVQGLGAQGRRRASHQAGAQQAAPDRPDGEGRATRPRAPQDRAAAAPAPAGRSASSSSAGSGRAWRRRRPRRRRPDRRPRRASRLRRRERRRQERAAQDGRRRT